MFCISATVFSFDSLANLNFIGLQYLTDEGCGFCHIIILSCDIIFKGTADIIKRSESETSVTLNFYLYSAWTEESQPHFQAIVN